MSCRFYAVEMSSVANIVTVSNIKGHIYLYVLVVDSILALTH